MHAAILAAGWSGPATPVERSACIEAFHPRVQVRCIPKHALQPTRQDVGATGREVHAGQVAGHDRIAIGPRPEKREGCLGRLARVKVRGVEGREQVAGIPQCARRRENKGVCAGIGGAEDARSRRNCDGEDLTRRAAVSCLPWSQPSSWPPLPRRAGR